MPYTKTFKELRKRVKETYLGKPVKKIYQNKFGKIYDKDEIMPLTYAIAKSKRIKIDIGGKNDI